MGYFNLPFGVRVAGSDPIDGDRYLAADLAARDALLTPSAIRAKAGQQVFVESNQTLYILKGTTNADWEEVGAGGNASGDKSFEFSPTSPELMWVVQHDLGKYPSVTVLNTSNEVVECYVNHTDKNKAVLTFNIAFEGTAIFN